MKTQTVLFVEDAELQQVGGGGQKFHKGETHELRTDQAQRWIGRGKAVLIPDGVKPTLVIAGDLTSSAVLTTPVNVIADTFSIGAPSADTVPVLTEPQPSATPEVAPAPETDLGRSVSKSKGGKR